MSADDLDAEIERARALDVDELADAIEAIGFECTRCGACCKGHGDEHTATVFPDEVRAIAGDRADDPDTSDDPATAYDWRDVARPMPFGLEVDADGTETGETFEWALQTDACGDCTFYEEGDAHGSGSCTVYGDRPLICETYPFSVEVASSEPMGDVVEAHGPVRAHECEGLGRDIDRADAEALARTLKARAISEVEELRAVLDAYEPVDVDPGEVVVHDSEGAKRPDGSPLE